MLAMLKKTSLLQKQQILDPLLVHMAIEILMMIHHHGSLNLLLMT